MLRNLSLFSGSRYLTLFGSNVLSSAERQFFKQTPNVEKVLLTGPGDPLVIPSRGMRGVKSIVLHKEIIDKHRLKKFEEEGKDALLKGGASSLTPQLSTLRPDDEDMPVEGLENPYAKPPKKCFLCEHNIELDYKNTRLLSQFVSPYTGRIYGRNVTGLCLFMQKRIGKLIKRSQYFGFMPYELKDPQFLKDPKLFDPFKRK